MESSRQLFQDFGLELILNTSGLAERQILPHLNFRELINLTRTSRAMHGLFSISTYRTVLQDALTQHLAHIIVNEPTKENIEILNNILQLYPDLVKRKIPRVVFEETGQVYIDYSLLQLAFAEYDDQLCNDIFKPCFEHIFVCQETAKFEIHKQLDEKFNEGSEEENQQREAEERDLLEALLIPVRVAITREQFNNGNDMDDRRILNSVTHAHIVTFRESFDALQPKEIHHGRRFSLNTAEIIYDDFARIDQQWARQFKHFERQLLYTAGLVSHMQRYMPQNIASSGAQGLYYLQDSSEVFERNTTLREDAATLKDDNVAGPRINFYGCLRQQSVDFCDLVGSPVYILDGAMPPRVPASFYFSDAFNGRMPSILSEYFSNKKLNLAELARCVERGQTTSPTTL